MRNDKISIQFDHFTIHKLAVASVIRSAVTAALEAQSVPVPVEINVLVTTDPVIRGINLSTRGIDSATDVLSFPMFTLDPDEPPADWSAYIDEGTGLCPLGDMAISLEHAINQAKQFGHSTRREVGYLTIHSVLHLLGFDHVDEGAMKAKMRAREEAIASSIPGVQR